MIPGHGSWDHCPEGVLDASFQSFVDPKIEPCCQIALQQVDEPCGSGTRHDVHADEAGTWAVVAVLLQQGEDNRFAFWSMEEKKIRKNDWTTFRIDASRRLPSDRSYYTFSGSRTTPP